MKDLDFDELDRAVNSLIPKAPTTTNTTNSLRSMDGISPKPVSGGAILNNISPSMGPVRQVPTPLASRRSAGRFMDMVRPAATPKPATSQSQSQPQPQPQTQPQPQPQFQPQPQHLQSTPSPAMTPVVPAASVNPAPVAATQTIAAPVTVEKPTTPPVTSPAGPGKWASLIGHNDVNKGSSIPKEAAVREGRPSIFSANFNKRASSVDDSELPESPFLTDAKVDKRPLGAFSGDPQALANAMPSQPVVTSNEPAVLGTQNNTSVTSGLPDELRDDLLRIESTDTVERPVVPAANPVTMTPPAPASIPVAPQVATPAAMPVGQPAVVSQPSQPNQPVQPGQPAALATDPNTTSIYDTSAYQKTIAHPAHQTAGWMWIVWILALLAIGGGAGAVVYFFVF